MYLFLIPLLRWSSRVCFGSQLYQTPFCTRVWNGWHFTWEICCKNANPQRNWSLFLFRDSLCTAGSLYQSCLIETLHNTQAGFSQPHHCPPPLLHGEIHCAAPGTSYRSHQVKNSTCALSGSPSFITRMILSTGCCLFHLASQLRTSEPWECGEICNTVEQTCTRMLMMHFQAPGGPGSYGMAITTWRAIITLWIISSHKALPGTGHQGGHLIPVQSQLSWRTEIDVEDRRSILNWLKENESLPFPWVVAGMGRLRQGHWWNFQQAPHQQEGTLGPYCWLCGGR